MFQINKRRLGLLCLAGATVAVSFAALGLPQDKNEKLIVIADITTYDYKKGLNYYEGHVQVDQGSTHLTADRMTTKSSNKHRIQEAIAYGIKEPAHFWTTPSSGEEVMNAYGKIIKFYPETRNTTLQGNVVVTQGQNNFHGQLIHYNMNDQTIIVPETKNGRAVLVYNPN